MYSPFMQYVLINHAQMQYATPFLENILHSSSANLVMESRWFSVGICKCKPGYKSHDLLHDSVLSLVDITAFRLERKFCKGFYF